MKLDMYDLQKILIAVSRAKNAYEALEQDSKNKKLISDMRKSGLDLDELGGFDLMTATLSSFYPDDSSREHSAGMILDHVWDGIGQWRR